MLKLAIIGFGGIASFHLERLMKRTDIKAVSSFDIDPKRQTLAKNAGLKVYEKSSDVFSDKEIDVVLISTPNDLHLPYVLEACKAKKAVVCEKPVTLNGDELKVLEDAVLSSGIFFTVHQNRRWDDDFYVASQIYKSNSLGKIFEIEQNIMGSRGIPGDWRKTKAQGGGMMLDWGVHKIDQLLTMIDADVVSLYAQYNHVRNSEVDDGFRLVLNFSNGVRALVNVDTNTYLKTPLWRIIGTDGGAEIASWDLNGYITTLNHSGKDERRALVTETGFTRTMAPRSESQLITEKLPKSKSDYSEFWTNVVNGISKGEKPLVSMRELKRCMKIMDYAFISARDNKVITETI